MRTLIFETQGFVSFATWFEAGFGINILEETMTGEEFGKKVKDGLEKFVKSSKDVFGKAGEAVQNFSDKSVVRIEKMQFESKREEQYAKLGKLVADSLEKNPDATPDFTGGEIPAILSEIIRMTKEIEVRKLVLESE